MLSPTTAPVAATSITSGTRNTPVDAKYPATSRMVSPGMGSPAFSSITPKKTAQYPYASMYCSISCSELWRKSICVTLQDSLRVHYWLIELACVTIRFRMPTVLPERQRIFSFQHPKNHRAKKDEA